MTTNTTPAEENCSPEQMNLLHAARQLREFQLAWIRSAQEIAMLTTEKKGAEAALEDAELELAEADLAFASTRVKVLRLIRTNRHHSTISLDLHQNHGNPREDLWRICATGSDEEIVAAALKLGEHDARIWENSEPYKKAQEDLRQAHEEMAVVSAARRQAVQKRGKAKAAVQAATEAVQEAYRRQPVDGCGYFELESNVVRAAASMTGTLDKQFAYSYCGMKELGITGPGLDLPSERMTPEEQARYWEQHGYSAKKAPGRDDE